MTKRGIQEASCSAQELKEDKKTPQEQRRDFPIVLTFNQLSTEKAERDDRTDMLQKSAAVHSPTFISSVSCEIYFAQSHSLIQDGKVD